MKRFAENHPKLAVIFNSAVKGLTKKSNLAVIGLVSTVTGMLPPVTLSGFFAAAIGATISVVGCEAALAAYKVLKKDAKPKLS